MYEPEVFLEGLSWKYTFGNCWQIFDKALRLDEVIKRESRDRKQKDSAMNASKIKRDDKMEAPGKVNEKKQPWEWEDHDLFHLDSIFFSHFQTLFSSNPYSSKQQE